MQDGNIVEQGSHEELLGRGSFYAELYNSQFVLADAQDCPFWGMPIPATHGFCISY